MHTVQLPFCLPCGQGLHTAVAFHLAVRAGAALRAALFQLPVRARGALCAALFQLPVRAGVTLPALKFLPSMRAPLDTHFSRATKLRAHALLRPRKRRGRSRGYVSLLPVFSPQFISFFFQSASTKHESCGAARRRGVRDRLDGYNLVLQP